MESKRKKDSVRFVSWNTCGVRDTADFPHKLEKIIKELDKLGTSVAFLQETHIGPNSRQTDILRCVSGWHYFFTVHHPRSKGVAILIKETLNYAYEFHDEDFGGSYIVLVCQLDGKYFTFVNVYNHIKDTSVLRRLTQYLHDNAKGILVIGGDFNTILHYDFDRKCPTGHKEPLRPFLEEFISSLNLVDVWGRSHPTDRQFTYFKGKLIQSSGSMHPKKAQRNTYKIASRLDMFFMPCDDMQYLKKCKIYNSDISDHDPVLLEIQLQPLTVVQMPLEIPNDPITHEAERDSFKVQGEISGAEVLTAIKSLRECREIFDSSQLTGHNKRALINRLKLEFNDMIRKTRDRKAVQPGSTEYLIFTTILARRLERYIRPSFKSKSKVPCSKTKTNQPEPKIYMRDVRIPKTIKWTHLQKAITALKRIHPAPPRVFDILRSLLGDLHGNLKLPKHSPLTNAILTLCLKWLAKELKSKLGECEVDVCRHRLSVLVYMHSNPDMENRLDRVVSQFRQQLHS
ncbi:hypothetical protein AALO_G00173140 [Alosa alosa]|uniref:exodeoxyribonuclease III n=1 Tax=Alosa alosa TaxID=278164 RepID=A0AAV6GBE5_9TELE|nr:hypothetical protein AALO_G00173140 [Alosa alosa]